MVAIAAAQPDPAAVTRLSGIPSYNAQLRTTCVATLLRGGHAVNALPQRAEVTVNCRILPTEPVEEVQQTLVRVVADEQTSITPIGAPTPSPASPRMQRLVEAI